MGKQLKNVSSKAKTIILSLTVLEEPKNKIINIFKNFKFYSLSKYFYFYVSLYLKLKLNTFDGFQIM